MDNYMVYTQCNTKEISCCCYNAGIKQKWNMCTLVNEYAPHRGYLNNGELVSVKKRYGTYFLFALQLLAKA